MPQYQQIHIHPNMTIEQLAVAVNENMNRLTQAAPLSPNSGWTVANATEKKDADVGTDTLTDTQNILATLVETLIAQGVLKP